MLFVRFTELVRICPEYARVGRDSLGKWGYSDKDAEAEALYRLWEFSQRDVTVAVADVNGYLGRSLVNAEISRHRRDRGRVVELVDEISYAIPAKAPFSLDSFNEIVERLDDIQRTLVTMVYAAGYEYSEVSEALNMPIGTVKSKLHRACEKLAHELRDLTPCPSPIRN